MGVFTIGMIVIDFSTKKSDILYMFGYCLMIVPCTMFINKAMIILGADNNNDVFILAVMLSTIISIITGQLISKYKLISK